MPTRGGPPTVAGRWSRLPEREALTAVIDELVDAIEGARDPVTDGVSGLRVLDVLESATRSLALGGSLVALERAW